MSGSSNYAPSYYGQGPGSSGQMPPGTYSMSSLPLHPQSSMNPNIQSYQSPYTQMPYSAVPGAAYGSHPYGSVGGMPPRPIGASSAVQPSTVRPRPYGVAAGPLRPMHVMPQGMAYQHPQGMMYAAQGMPYMMPHMQVPPMGMQVPPMGMSAYHAYPPLPHPGAVQPVSKVALPGSRNYRTVTCRNWVQGSCRRGEQCSFLHGYPDQQSEPSADKDDNTTVSDPASEPLRDSSAVEPSSPLKAECGNTSRPAEALSDEPARSSEDALPESTPAEKDASNASDAEGTEEATFEVGQEGVHSDPEGTSEASHATSDIVEDARSASSVSE